MNKNFLLGLAFFFLACIIIRMAEQTWGDLPESQISNRLITEAIAEAISAHESDPTAHLGTGESLEQHKVNDVIDHPAGSVLNDKFSMTEYYLQLPLTDNVLFQTFETGFGTYDDTNPPSVSVQVFDDASSARRSATISGVGSLLDYDKDTYIEFTFVLNEHAHYKAYMLHGKLVTGAPTGGYGFEIDDDVLRGFYVNGGGIQYTSSLTFSIGVFQNVRAVFVLSENAIHFFVNGNDVATLAVSSPVTGTTYDHIEFGAFSKTAGVEVALDIFNIYFSRSII